MIKEGPLAIQNYNQGNQAIRRKMRKMKNETGKKKTGSLTGVKKFIVESEQETARRRLTL